MPKLVFTATLFFLFMSFSSLLQAENPVQNTVNWHDWSNETFTLAEQQNKLVLLDISAPWCQFCKKMKAVTYQHPEVIKIINESYIAIHADIELSTDVRILYGDFGVPGTVILTAEREELNKRLGYIPPQEMQWHLLGSLQDAASLISSTAPMNQ